MAYWWPGLALSTFMTIVVVPMNVYSGLDSCGSLSVGMAVEGRPGFTFEDPAFEATGIDPLLIASCRITTGKGHQWC